MMPLGDSMAEQNKSNPAQDEAEVIVAETEADIEKRALGGTFDGVGEVFR